MCSYHSVEYQQAVAELFSRRQHGTSGCARVKNVLEKLGFSQSSLGTVVHVAGTNGKGSAAKMISTVLSQKGSVGLFTSPHLVCVNERIQINNACITNEVFMRLYVRVRGFELSFFETLTVMALLYFAQEHVDYAVLEVGMGGRRDATNAIDAHVCAITRIGLDHQRFLGPDKESIAKEKAGIIKDASHVYITHANHDVKSVFYGRGARTTWCQPTSYSLSLLGAHQQENAGVAQAVCEHLGCTDDAILHGLQTTLWPGRLQWLTDSLLLDVAHNEDAFYSLASYLNTLSRPYVLLFAASHHRSDEGLRLLTPTQIIFTQAGAFATPVDSFTFPGERIPDVSEAFFRAKTLAQNELLVVVGSAYLVGEILKLHAH